MSSRKTRTQKIIDLILMERFSSQEDERRNSSKIESRKQSSADQPPLPRPNPLGFDKKADDTPVSLPKPEIAMSPPKEKSDLHSAQNEVIGESSPKPPKTRSTPKDEIVPEKTEGYVKFQREQFGHWVSKQKPWNDGYAWTYLYARGNYEPVIVNFRGEYIKIERSMFVTSKIKLGAIFGWGKIRVNSFLRRLVSDNMIMIESTKRYCIITIRNYGKYQGRKNQDQPTEKAPDQPTESQQQIPCGQNRGPADRRRTGGGQADIDKKIKNKRIYVADSIESQLSFLLLEEIRKNKPDFKEPNLQAWAKEVDLMIRRDGRNSEKIRQVIQWAQKDSFWHKNILSTGKLRAQFDRLEMDMGKGSSW